MQMSRQTVWLVTMLTLMVVLSAYYIVTGPVQPANQEVMKEKEPGSLDVSIKQVDKPAEDGKKDEKKSEGNEGASTATSSSNDYIVGYHLQQNALRSKMTEEWMKVLANPDATKEDRDEAQAKINGLMKVNQRESVVEELIRKEGFRQAVVVSNNNNTHVDVMVQSKDLSRAQAVKLIGLIKDQMSVAPLNVSVRYLP